MSGKDDWFRNKTWSAEIEQAYFARLARSRSGRPQYLYIQACVLSRSPEPGAIEVALRLVEQYLSEYPSDFHRACAMEVRARCHELSGRLDLALADLRASADLQASGARGGRTQADLNFAWLVATRDLRPHDEEALARLARFEKERGAGLMFLDWRFRLSAARALILAERGDAQAAREHARAALAVAAETESGLQYHPRVGVVGDQHADVRGHLARIADGSGRRVSLP